MKNYQEDVFVVGNIGTPYTTAVEKMTDNTITVAEMSSFQLESIVDFRPRSKCNPEFHTGSSESPSYDGGSICQCKEKYCKESDRR